MTDDDPVARVDALVASIGSNLDAPVVNRRDVVLVTGPWLAGVTGVATALRERLTQHTFVEATELAPGAAPKAVVFVVSGAAPVTESDCTLLDAAAENTDVVVAVVTKIDVHYGWRDVLAANSKKLTRHARRYGRVPWVGVAAAPEVGEPQVDELIVTVREQLADSDVARRNRLRAWESRLQKVAQRFDRDADGAGRRARVDSLRDERSAALRQRRETKSERTITLRGQLQQARVQLSYLARTRSSEVRTELQEDIAALPRRAMPGIEDEVRRRFEGVVTEVGAAVDTNLAEIAQAVGLPLELGPLEPPTVPIPPAQLKARRLETRLMMVFGVVFGLGVALTLSRLVAGLAPHLHPAYLAGGIAACVALGLAMTVWVVHIRALLGDRNALDRWAGEASSSLRSVLEQMASSRVLVGESLLTSATAARDEVENSRVTEQVSVIDAELREHALAAARAAAARDREKPTVQAALDAVHAELGEPAVSRDDSGPRIPRAASPSPRPEPDGSSR